MAKQIAISDDVYNMLLKMKGDNKSFSEVIRMLTGQRKSAASTAAGKRLAARMEKGYDFGRIIGSRDEWHAR